MVVVRPTAEMENSGSMHGNETQHNWFLHCVSNRIAEELLGCVICNVYVSTHLNSIVVRKLPTSSVPYDTAGGVCVLESSTISKFQSPQSITTWCTPLATIPSKGEYYSLELCCF